MEDDNGLGCSSSIPVDPPVNDADMGFFWDLENCSVPPHKSALQLVSALRGRFGKLGAEREFAVVCDVLKEPRHVVDELNGAQVHVLHVSSAAKNAADEKLKACLRRFGNTYKYPAIVILISGDVNFAPELSDLRYRCGFIIIVIHGSLVNDALLTLSHFHFAYDDILLRLGERAEQQLPNFTRFPAAVAVAGLPKNVPANRLRDRLKQLSDNCGGRVASIDVASGTAALRFPNAASTLRALKRLDGADVFGQHIATSCIRLPVGPSQRGPDNSVPQPQCFPPPRLQQLQPRLPPQLLPPPPWPFIHDPHRFPPPPVPLLHGSQFFVAPPPAPQLGSKGAIHPVLGTWKRPTHQSVADWLDTEDNSQRDCVMTHRSSKRRVWSGGGGHDRQGNHTPMGSSETSKVDSQQSAECLPPISQNGFGRQSKQRAHGRAQHRRVNQHRTGGRNNAATSPGGDNQRSGEHVDAQVAHPSPPDSTPAGSPQYARRIRSVDEATDCLKTMLSMQKNSANVQLLSSASPSPFRITEPITFENQTQQRVQHVDRPFANGGQLQQEYNAAAEPDYGNRVSNQAQRGHNHGVDLMVDNLDRSLNMRELREALINLFSQKISVRYVTIVPRPDNTLYALVQTRSLREARVAVAELHGVPLTPTSPRLSVALPPGVADAVARRPAAATAENVQQACDLIQVDFEASSVRDNDQFEASQPPDNASRSRHEAIEILLHSETKSLPLSEFVSELDRRFGGLYEGDLECLRHLVRLTRTSDGTYFARLNSMTQIAKAMGYVPTSYNEVIGGAQAAKRSHSANSAGPSYGQPPQSHLELNKRRTAPEIDCLESGPGDQMYWNTRPPLGITESEWLLGEALAELLVTEPSLSLPIRQLLPAFENYHGWPVLYEDYGCGGLRELLEKKMAHVVTVTRDEQPSPCGGPPLTTVSLASHRARAVRSQQIFYVFLRKPDIELAAAEFRRQFRAAFQCDCDPVKLCHLFAEILCLVPRPGDANNGGGGVAVRLQPVQRFALLARLLLLNFGGRDVPLPEFEYAYVRRYKQDICPRQYGYSTLIGLIRAASHVLYIKGRGSVCSVCINRNFLTVLRCIKPDIIVPSPNGGLDGPPLNRLRPRRPQQEHNAAGSPVKSAPEFPDEFAAKPSNDGSCDKEYGWLRSAVDSLHASDSAILCAVASVPRSADGSSSQLHSGDKFSATAAETAATNGRTRALAADLLRMCASGDADEQEENERLHGGGEQRPAPFRHFPSNVMVHMDSSTDGTEGRSQSSSVDFSPLRPPSAYDQAVFASPDNLILNLNGAFYVTSSGKVNAADNTSGTDDSCALCVTPEDTLLPPEHFSSGRYSELTCGSPPKVNVAFKHQPPLTRPPAATRQPLRSPCSSPVTCNTSQWANGSRAASPLSPRRSKLHEVAADGALVSQRRRSTPNSAGRRSRLAIRLIE